MKKTGLKSVLHKVSMMQIPENALLHDVVKMLRERESFVDADGGIGERIYHGDIFETLASEGAEMDGVLKPSSKTIKHLEELAKLVDTDYVQITMTHLYK